MWIISLEVATFIKLSIYIMAATSLSAYMSYVDRRFVLGCHQRYANNLSTTQGIAGNNE